MGNILGIDWGSRQLGVALASAEARLPRPLPSLDNTPDLFEELRQICHQEEVAQLVVGLPRNLNGEETAQSAEVRTWAKNLEQSLDLPVAFQDETLTTQVAEQRADPKFDTHSRAAAIILQDYLDAGEDNSKRYLDLLEDNKEREHGS